MPLAQLGTLVLLNVAGMATPGPDLLLLTRMATRSRRHALASVTGISTGLVLWVSLTVFGAAALLIAYPVLESVIKLVGGVWLVWMGRGMILAARAQFRDRMNADIDVNTIFGTPWKSYQQGLFTNLSNPKVVLYFAAIIAPLMPAHPTMGDAVLIVLSIVASTFLGFSTLAFSFPPRPCGKDLSRRAHTSTWVLGYFFVIAGASLAINGIATLLMGK